MAEPAAPLEQARLSPYAHKKTSRIRGWFICLLHAFVDLAGQFSNQFVADLKRLSLLAI
jgi:hypothetical protein